MSVELSIISALVGSAVIFAYISFQLNNSNNFWLQWLGILFFGITLSFVLGLVWSALQIADNNGLTYLTPGLNAFLNIVMWILLIVIIGLFINMIYIAVRELIHYTKLSINPRSQQKKERKNRRALE